MEFSKRQREGTRYSDRGMETEMHETRLRRDSEWDNPDAVRNQIRISVLFLERIQRRTGRTEIPKKPQFSWYGKGKERKNIAKIVFEAQCCESEKTGIFTF